MLTSAERDLIARAFANGPSVLLEEGYTQDDIHKFCSRPDVAAQFALLERELDLREELEARTRHTTRRQMSRLTPGAVAIVAQALAGPQYLTYKTPDGVTAIQTDAAGKPILIRPEVSMTQVRAAEVILETLGIPFGRARNEVSQSVGSKVGLLFRPPDAEVVVSVDDPLHENDAQRSLSRERVRTVIAVLSERVPALHQNLNENLGLVPQAPPKTPPPPPVKRKKAPRAAAKTKGSG
jgi:hypothetical protein